ncbi:hypothetical protein [Caudoviricetes sp.]|nr:hypothetical protein [Caudoviricetes sp.]
MKNALISPTEKVFKYDGTLLGDRIAEVADVRFEVADPLFWVDCADDVVADQFYYDGTACQPIPVKPKDEATGP